MASVASWCRRSLRVPGLWLEEAYTSARAFTLVVVLLTVCIDQTPSWREVLPCPSRLRPPVLTFRRVVKLSLVPSLARKRASVASAGSFSKLTSLTCSAGAAQLVVATDGSAQDAISAYSIIVFGSDGHCASLSAGDENEDRASFRAELPALNALAKAT